jgi:serine/threonine protein kinase
MAVTPEDESRLLTGRYALGRALGSDDTATVFAATDTVLGRAVAIKFLQIDAAQQYAECFRREAQIGAGRNHPNLAAVYDIISEDDAVLSVMEYVDGPSLEVELERGPLSRERAVPIRRGLAAALDYAHEAGIVHRDVKPANVVLAPDGQAKLVELRTATVAEQRLPHTTQELRGTPSYNTPERLSAGSASTAASDIYSLAMLALRMLAGEIAGRGAGPAERLRLVDGGAPETAAVWPDGPAAARAALEQSLDPDPTLRHRTARALVEELASSLGDESVVSDPAEPIDLLAAPCRRTQASSALPAPAERLWPRRPRRGTRPLGAEVAALGLTAVVTTVVLIGGSESGPDVVAGTSDAGTQRSAAVAAQRRAAAGSRQGNASGGRQRKASAGRPGNAAVGRKGNASAGADVTAGAGSESGELTAADQIADLEDPVPGVASFAAGRPEDDRRGSELSDRGFALLRSGDTSKAAQVLERSVQAFERGTDDSDYADALLNYGNALRLSGQPAEAIPVLEARMQIPDQTEIVQDELDAAHADMDG